MDIRFISTLTPDDEARIAAALCAAAGPILARFAIAYTIRIETTDGRSFHQQSVPDAADVRAGLGSAS